MAEPFDPYLKWLGIPPKHQPPNDYRLLGIEVFESDPDVIAHASDQRMAHLKNFGTGQHARLSEKILNEIAAARVRLLNPAERAKYDAALRKQLQSKQASSGKLSAVTSLPSVVPRAAPRRGTASSVQKPTAAVSSGAKRPPWLIPAAVCGGVCVLVLVLAMLWTAGRDVPETANKGKSDTGSRPSGTAERKDEDPPTVVEKPESTATLDDDPEGLPPEDTPPEDTPPEDTPPEDTPPPPDDSTPVEPDRADPPAKKKLTPPPEAAIKRTAQEVRELYEEEFAAAQTPQQKAALARQLNRDGLGTREDPVARFALLEMAAGLAAEAEDPDQALEIIDQIDQLYAVDVLHMKADTLEKVAKIVVRRPGALAANQQIVVTARQLTTDALGQGDVKAALRFVKMAIPSARKFKDTRLLAVLQSSAKELEQLRSRQDLVQQAVAALGQNPDHPKASQVAGTWYCFIAGDWEKGLPWLAKGEDPDLAELAARDLTNPTDANRQVAVADGWWELSETRKGLETSALEARAVYWYKKALPNLSGLSRRKVEKQLEEMNVTLGNYALALDGQKSHVIVHNANYIGQTPITVEAIVKPGRSGSSPSVGIVSSSSEAVIIGNGQTAGLALGTYVGRWSFRFHYSYATSLRTYSRVRRISSNNRITSQKWTHVAGVYDVLQKEVRLYVNGQLETSLSLSGPHRASPFPFVIGAVPSGPSSPAAFPVTGCFAGAIRAIRISNVPLYQQSFTPPEELENEGKATVLLLRFDEGRGNRVSDAAGSKLFGEIRDAEWIELDKKDLPPSAPHFPARPPQQ